MFANSLKNLILEFYAIDGFKKFFLDGKSHSGAMHNDKNDVSFVG